MFENGRNEEKGLPVGWGRGCRDPRVAVSCFMGLQGRGDGFILENSRFPSQSGEFLEGQERAAAGGPEMPKLASLVGPCLRGTAWSRRWRAGPALAGFLPITSHRCG